MPIQVDTVSAIHLMFPLWTACDGRETPISPREMRADWLNGTSSHNS